MILPQLSDASFVQSLCDDLYELFKVSVCLFMFAFTAMYLLFLVILDR